MKIKVKNLSYEKVALLTPSKFPKTKKPNILFRTLLKIVSTPDLIVTGFKCRKIGMERLGKGEPCLILMNHSSFIDLKIASSILYPRPFNIVCTTDGFVGKNWLMRQLGCIPTNKFITDIRLVREMKNALIDKKSSVLMYPEASYSFDGTATPLPDSIGKCVKTLGVPVVMIRTYGAFTRDPLYNGLRRRKVQVSADMEYIISPEDTKAKSAGELQDIINSHFNFDNFRWQQENGVIVKEDFRAEGLNRVLYKCPHCGSEKDMVTAKTKLYCKCCNKEYTLTEQGFLETQDGDAAYTQVADWYKWQRECVREEILNNTYSLKKDVDILMMIDSKSLYRVGEGVLVHTKEGFKLTGCNGAIEYTQKPTASYSLYSDYHWYEIGDMISIGTNKARYYCFPKDKEDIVAKTRLATEEMYKLAKEGLLTV